MKRTARENTLRLTLETLEDRCCPSTMDFIVPVGTNILVFPAESVIIFTQPSTTRTSVATCAGPGDYEVWSAVNIAPGQGAFRIDYIIPLGPTPIRSGTRVESIQALGGCSGFDNQPMDKYRGVLE